MSMPSYDDAYEKAADKPAFSNGSEFEEWAARWCWRCANDADDSCPLVLVAMMERTPAEWAEDKPGSLGCQYTCTLFSSRG
jgi:hypothetical protein